MYDAGVIQSEIERLGISVTSVSIGKSVDQVSGSDGSRHTFQVGNSWVGVEFQGTPNAAQISQVHDSLSASTSKVSSRSIIRITQPSDDPDLVPQVDTRNLARMLDSDEVTALVARLQARYPDCKVEWLDAPA